MTELGPVSRSLVSAARDGLGPDPDAAARVRAKVAAVIAGGGAVAAAAAATTTTAQAATAAAAVKVSIAGKLIAAAVISAIAAATVVGLAMHRDVPASAAPQLTIAADPEEPLAPAARTARDELAPQAANPPAPASAPATRPFEPPSLAREVAAIDTAMAAMRAGEPARALAELARYERETRGRGQLAEDAAAITIEAHCALGDDVSVELATFDHRWPTSAQLSRIEHACDR